MRHRPRPRAPSIARPYAIHSLQLPVLAVIDLLNVLTVRAAFRSQGSSTWLPRTHHLSAPPTCATARGARSRQPGPPEAAQTPPAPRQGPVLRQVPALRQAPDRPPRPCFSRGEPSRLRPALRPRAPAAVSVA